MTTKVKTKPTKGTTKEKVQRTKLYDVTFYIKLTCTGVARVESTTDDKEVLKQLAKEKTGWPSEMYVEDGGPYEEVIFEDLGFGDDTWHMSDEKIFEYVGPGKRNFKKLEKEIQYKKKHTFY